MSILPQTLLLPQQSVSGAGAILQLAELTHGFGPSGVLVHGHSLEKSGSLENIIAGFGDNLLLKTHCHTGNEPTVLEVDALRKVIKDSRADWVTAVGGGSVIDLAKAAAGLVDHPQDTAFYQINPAAIEPARIPLIAAPTTAGTGSEATVVSVLTNLEKGLKQSIRHPSHMPKIVILDPELLGSCPAATIAAAGLDAFVQAFESYTSRTATPFTQQLAELAIQRISKNLLSLYQNPACSAAASEMLEASYITGVAFSHSRLGIVHGLAHPLGIRFKVAHGLCCACILPTAMEFNREHIQTHLNSLKTRCGIDVNAMIQNWMTSMQLENPFIGKTIHDMDAFVTETLTSGSTKANPREVTADDVRWLAAHILNG